jgi:hypothetical protein
MILKVDQGDYNWSSRQREFDQRVNTVSVDAALLCPKTKNRLALGITNRTGLNPELLGSAPLLQIPTEKLPRDDCLQMAVAHS